MDKEINALIKIYADKANVLERLVVTAFLRCHSLEAGQGYLSGFMVTEKDDMASEIEVLSRHLSLEDVITIFELAIPETERTVNGAVYTPCFVRDYIVRHVLRSSAKPLETCLCADVACGCGAFLYTLAERIHARTKASFATIYHHLFGVDISKISIRRAKILLSLAADRKSVV